MGLVGCLAMSVASSPVTRLPSPRPENFAQPETSTANAGYNSSVQKITPPSISVPDHDPISIPAHSHTWLHHHAKLRPSASRFTVPWRW